MRAQSKTKTLQTQPYQQRQRIVSNPASSGKSASRLSQPIGHQKEKRERPSSRNPSVSVSRKPSRTPS